MFNKTSQLMSSGITVRYERCIAQLRMLYFNFVSNLVPRAWSGNEIFIVIQMICIGRIFKGMRPRTMSFKLATCVSALNQSKWSKWATLELLLIFKKRSLSFGVIYLPRSLVLSNTRLDHHTLLTIKTSSGLFFFNRNHKDSPLIVETYRSILCYSKK